ncbi:MAG: hypothetical protein KDB82_15120 [Planctomycetes bacterium]|nr:hypothetical protein [Planctomycetota bacterium]
MSKNEDRIWDVLIEDALRDSTAAGEPHPPGDRTQRLLTPLGPIGVDRGRSMRRTRGRRWVSVTATVIAFVLVAGLFYAAVTWLPELAKTNDTVTPDQPQTADDNNQSPAREGGGQDTPDKPKPNAAPENEPKDKTQPETNTEPEPEANDQPEPQPEEQPEPKPEDQVEQPKPETQPEPEPKEPEDTVEKPKPDDTVEQPKQPEETTPEPDTKLHINLLTEVDWYKPGDKLLQVSNDGKLWTQAFKMTQFAGNIWLRSRSAMDFEAGGVFLRLDGTMRVSLTDTGLKVELSDDKLYVDNRGARKDVSFSDGRNDATLNSCSVYFERSASRTQVSLYEGDLKIGEDVVSGPKEGDLTKRGKREFRALRHTMERNGFLFDVESRVVYREDFVGEKPEGRLREGTIEDGVLKGATVFWGYPDHVQYETGMIIRLRVRFTGTTSVTLTQFAVPREDNFSYEIDADHGLKLDEWYTLEVPLSEFRERTNHRDPPNEEDWFQNVSLSPTGENAQVELDWVELIHAVK